MSALEPDAPAAHVFPHVREAIRAWYAHRIGSEPSRSALGGVRGKGPRIGDVLRVGQVLACCGVHGRGSRVSVPGRDLIDWALGKRPRSAFADGSTGSLEVYIALVTRRMRAAGLVAKGKPRFTRRTEVWADSEGVEHESTSTVDYS